MTRTKRTILAVLAVLLSPMAAHAGFITTSVPGSVSLYFDDWGHVYNIPGSGNEFDALGRGVAATSVAYTFTVGAMVDITASNCVVDAGELCTGPDGLSGLWRGLTVYSLIGIWSDSSTGIVPASDPFLVGSSLSTVAAGRWLFLAENNGIFTDNHEGAYDVEITTVPEPGTLALFGLGLMGLGFLGRRKNRA